jgi:5-methylcytosine-specific restriction protein B
LKKAELTKFLMDVADITDADNVTEKERAGRQIKANALYEGSSSPASERKPLGIFYARDAVELAVQGAVRRMSMQLPYPDAIVALLKADTAERHARVFGYVDSNIALKLAQAFNVPLEDVQRPPGPTTMTKVGSLDISDLISALSKCPNVVLQGPPGTGKSSLALELIRASVAHSEFNAEECRYSNLLAAAKGDFSALGTAGSVAQKTPVVWEMVQLHPAYGYDDLVRRVVPTSSSGSLQFVVQDQLLPRLCSLALSRAEDQPVILVLDEINRCNLAAALGELIFAIDPSHRGKPVRLKYQGQGLSHSMIVPPNLWIIGTMNSADRSIAMVDYAVRRRFRFLDVDADPKHIQQWYTGKPTMGALAVNLFECANFGLARSVMVGHSAFMIDPFPSGTWPQRLARQIAYHVAPLLLEYEREGLRDGSSLTWSGKELNLKDGGKLATAIANELAAKIK